MSLPILIVSQDLEHRNTLSGTIFGFGLRPVCCGTLSAAKALLERQQFAAVVCEDLPEKDFQSVIAQSAAVKSKTPIIVASRLQGTVSYMAVMNAGALDRIDSPLSSGELKRVLAAALGKSEPLRGMAQSS